MRLRIVPTLIGLLALAGCGELEDTETTDTPGDDIGFLAESCRADQFDACDELWQRSDLGSELERLAASCNWHQDIGDAAEFGHCVERFATSDDPDASAATETPEPEPSADWELVPPIAPTWVVVLMSVEEDSGPGAGFEMVDRLAEIGVEANVFLTNQFGSLNPGWYLVYTGEYDDPDRAGARCEELRGVVPDCYQRLVANE